MVNLRQTIGMAAIAMAGQVVAVAAQDAGDARRGYDFAAMHCARCHAIKAGDASSPRDGLASFQTIARAPGFSDLALEVFLRTPHKEMPNLILDRRERADVIAYIRSLAR